MSAVEEDMGLPVLEGVVPQYARQGVRERQAAWNKNHTRRSCGPHMIASREKIHDQFLEIS